MNSNKIIAAFDIGGTSLKMGLISHQGEIIAKDKQDIDNCSGQQILDGILAWVKRYPEAQGIAVSAPGYVNPVNGFITMGGAIRDFDHFALSEWLKEQTSLPVSVENDANCALLAERWLGKAQTMSSFLMMTIGTGIGGALFCNGGLVRGHQFRAGEFGYILTERPGSERVTRYSMNENTTLRTLRKQYALHVGRPWQSVTGEEIFANYDSGDAICTKLVNRFYEGLCAGIYNLANVFDPECLFLAGGITERPQFYEEIQNYMKWFDLTLNIAIASHKNEAGLLGAVYHFIKQQANTENLN